MKSILIELNHKAGKNTARKAKIGYCKAETKEFPDSESYVRIPGKVKGKKAFLLADFGGDANDTLVKAMLAAKTAGRMGAKKVFLVAPYLPYLRQDEEFKKGEALAGKIVSGFLSEIFDGVISVDPHLHRTPSLSKFFSCKTQKLTATKAIASYLKQNKKGFVVIGPDEESKQWVKQVAEKASADYAVAKKTRLGSRKVRVKIKKSGVGIKGKKAIIVDDIISTGHTILEAVKGIKKEKPKSIECYCVHGIFAENAHKKIQKSGTGVFATNTTKNPVEKIDVSGILAEGIKKWA